MLPNDYYNLIQSETVITNTYYHHHFYYLLTVLTPRITLISLALTHSFTHTLMTYCARWRINHSLIELIIYCR